VQVGFVGDDATRGVDDPIRAVSHLTGSRERARIRAQIVSEPLAAGRD
jgi:hypothetical protein